MLFMPGQGMIESYIVVGSTARWDDFRSEQHVMPTQNDLLRKLATSSAAS